MDSQTLDGNLINEKVKYNERDIANGGRRFANSLIDTLVLYGLYFIIFMIGTLGGEISAESAGTGLFIYVIMLAYYTIMEFTTGKTIGKMLTGTKVVDLEGNKPDLKMAFIRSICRFIPFEGFSFLGTPCAGWHDTIAKSRVVYDR